jgi:transcriptional regulator with XRE-family HTH domain
MRVMSDDRITEYVDLAIRHLTQVEENEPGDDELDEDALADVASDLGIEFTNKFGRDEVEDDMDVLDSDALVAAAEAALVDKHVLGMTGEGLAELIREAAASGVEAEEDDEPG